jgi:hypothetical protein
MAEISYWFEGIAIFQQLDTRLQLAALRKSYKLLASSCKRLHYGGNFLLVRRDSDISTIGHTLAACS